MNKALRRGYAAAAALALALPALAACAGGSQPAQDGDLPSVTFITMTDTVPYFISMRDAAKEEAEKLGLPISFEAGKFDGDEQGQITAVENAITRGDDAIVITPSGPGVSQAIAKAKDAGLLVIQLENSLPPEEFDLTVATNNLPAGVAIGEYAKGKLKGKDLKIAMLGFFTDKVVKFDIDRYQGFLEGLGIDVGDPAVKGDEATSGTYDGGNYQIVCNEQTNGAEDLGRTAMENCLSRNPDINLVFTGSEPIAAGAANALEAAGLSDQAMIVSVDGGCTGVQAIEAGQLAATAQQYPAKMAEIAMDAVLEYSKSGTLPAVTEGDDYVDTGTALVTNTPLDGLTSIDTAAASKICWG